MLVTGISGFVGPIIARELVSRGAEVFGLTRRKAHERTPKRCEELMIENKVRFLEGDLTDLSSLQRLFDLADPEVLFHLGAQSFVPYSFVNPLETIQTNITGTSNLLEAARLADSDVKFIFAGSSEEYGLVISSQEQYNRALEKYKTVFPVPTEIPEIPTKETSPLRPMSPYAASKVAGEYITRNFWNTYGIKTVISRAFNHEGAGRGIMFVTSAIVSQALALKQKRQETIKLGNVSAFRDWSHVNDVVNGYILLSELGESGEVYNQGSMRTNSVLTYLLWTLEELDYKIQTVKTLQGDVEIQSPTDLDSKPIFGINFTKTKADRLLLEDKIDFSIEHIGLQIEGPNTSIQVIFDESRFRPSEVPILLSDSSKIKKLGVTYDLPVKNIINDQIQYYSTEKYSS